MMAQGVKDDAHLEQLFYDPMFIAQEKLDGMRAIVHVTKDGLRIFSRSAGVGDPSSPLEKTSSLPHLATLKFPQLDGTILDTEILIPGTDSATLSGAVHRREVQQENHLVKIFVFDILHEGRDDLMNQILLDRLETLDRVKEELCHPYITVLPVATTRSAKHVLYNRVLATGGEGVILKRLDASYVPGARPGNNWYKAKRSATFDCVIIGFTRGEGRFNKWIGAVRFGQYVDGKLVELGQASGMTDAVRTEMSEYPEKYVGKVVKIKGMQRLKSGAIRHPQFAGLNPDKKQKDCIWYQGEQ